MSASRYKKLPVKETGCYQNDAERRLEYWFCLGSRRAMIGSCALNMPPVVKNDWECECTARLQRLILRKVKDGTLRFDAPAVSALKGKIV